MSVWRYKAIPVASGAQVLRGEIAGETASAARAALRRSGLQVVELKPLEAFRTTDAQPGSRWWRAHLCRRRQTSRAELYDGLGTMLDAGLPLVEAIETQIRSARVGSQLRPVLIQLREDVRSGASLGHAMRRHDSWFHPVEVAMVDAGHHAGNLSQVLRVLSARHERSGELSQKLVAALTYPVLVGIVGTGVLIFLSTKTLPDLVLILEDSRIEVPALTARVMAVGGVLAHWGWLIALGAVILCGGVLALRRMSVARRWPWLARLHRLSPAVLRRVALARVAAGLSELIGSGVPLVEALRVLAPSITPAALRACLGEAADRLERGADLPTALDDETWFDAEFRRLLEVGQTSGELERLLERLAERYDRRARRGIERVAALVEPAAILTLAVLVGFVVMAAILPILRLQEIL